MQSQMEAKLAQMSLKSPALKSGVASSSPRNFSNPQNRQSLALDTTTANNFLSPDSAAVASPNTHDAAATLAQQRAKLKANNAAHRISAPVLSSAGVEGRSTWGSALGQVVEQNAPAQELTVPSSGSLGARPKSTEFSGSLGSPRPGGDMLSPIVGDSWASMVNTPLIPMFGKDSHSTQNLDAAAVKLNEWAGTVPRVPLMADPKSFRRVSKGNTAATSTASDSGRDSNNGNFEGDGNFGQGQRRNVGQNNQANGQGSWNNGRSPALQGANRFGAEDGLNGMNGLGMAGFNLTGLGSPGLGMAMPNAGLLSMNPLQMNMLNMQAQMNALGMTPEAQILAAQMAAGFSQPGWLGLQQAAMQGNNGGASRNRGGANTGRSPGASKANIAGANGGAVKKDEEEVDPALLNDIPAWLRSLRLHKYTPNFESAKWQDMVLMDEAALEAKGVAALGARRKMLKTFELVRKKMGIEAPASAGGAIGGSGSGESSA